MAAALGRAWLSDPRVLLVDEPLAGVDARSRAGIAGVLRAASEAGRIVVCTAHDVVDAAIARRVNVLSGGQRVFSGAQAALAAAAFE